MESSEAMLQHRAIRLTEEAGAQLDGQIGTDPPTRAGPLVGAKASVGFAIAR